MQLKTPDYSYVFYIYYNAHTVLHVLYTKLLASLKTYYKTTYIARMAEAEEIHGDWCQRQTDLAHSVNIKWVIWYKHKKWHGQSWRGIRSYVTVTEELWVDVLDWHGRLVNIRHVSIRYNVPVTKYTCRVFKSFTIRVNTESQFLCYETKIFPCECLTEIACELFGISSKDVTRINYEYLDLATGILNGIKIISWKTLFVERHSNCCIEVIFNVAKYIFTILIGCLCFSKGILSHDYVLNSLMKNWKFLYLKQIKATCWGD